MSPDVIVIGAGIVGAACADACAREGLRVLVVDRGIVGGGATAAGMGHIVVMDDSEAQFALTKYSRDLWNELPELPMSLEYLPCGTLWIAADDSEMAEVRRKHAFYRARAVPTNVLDAKALAEAEPNLRQGLAGALHVPADSVVYPPAAARFLLERARAQFVSGEAVAVDGNAVVFADGSRRSAGAIVNACALDAGLLMPEVAVPIKPRKGHLLITDRYPDFVRHQLVELGYLKSAHSFSADSVAFNVQPRFGGQLLVGSSRQFGHREDTIDEPILSRMLSRAVEYLPGLRRLSSIRAWTGFRASTPDKLPVIGPCPGRENVWIAAGHEGLGITTSLGTGALIAAMICGKPAALPTGCYSPERLVPAHV